MHLQNWVVGIRRRKRVLLLLAPVWGRLKNQYVSVFIFFLRYLLMTSTSSEVQYLATDQIGNWLNDNHERIL